MIKALRLFFMAVIAGLVPAFAMNIADVDFSMFNEFVDNIEPTTLEERSSPTNPKYFTTGVIKPELADVEIEGIKYRRVPSLSITYLPVKDAGAKQVLKSLQKNANKLSPDKLAQLREWEAELE